MQEMIPLAHPSTWETLSRAPFHSWDGMVHFINQLRYQNDDAMILMDGLEGSGKSTLAFQLANAIDPKWEAEDGLIIDFEDWENLYDLGQRRVFILDEGGDLMFSRDSMKGENKLVIRMFQMARIFNHVIIVCCPNIHWVDLYVRDHRALIYIHAMKEYHASGVERGKAIVHWPRRWFDWDAKSWESRWDEVINPLEFEEIPNHYAKWKRYEQLKRAKVQIRQQELQASLKSGGRKRNP